MNEDTYRRECMLREVNEVYTKNRGLQVFAIEDHKFNISNPFFQVREENPATDPEYQRHMDCLLLGEVPKEWWK